MKVIYYILLVTLQRSDILQLHITQSKKSLRYITTAFKSNNIM